jgi:hypothetical protein
MCPLPILLAAPSENKSLIVPTRLLMWSMPLIMNYVALIP